MIVPSDQLRDAKKATLFIFHLASIIVTTVLALVVFASVKHYDIYASNVLTNPSFTGGTTGWTLSGTTYDSSTYQDSAGSINASSPVGRKKTGSGSVSQTISTQISSGSSVYLNLYWSKSCISTGCLINTIEVKRTISGDTQTVWSNTSTSTQSWTQVSNTDISSYFTTTGTYTLEISFNLQSGNNSSAQALAWVDNINLDVTPPNTTVGNTGTQVSTLKQGESNKYVGGAFTFVRSAGSTTVTSITINETGTISDSNISGLILYYKQETTCSTSIPGDATVFNSTPGTFSSGSSTVTGTMSVGTSQVCVYVEVDISSGAQIDNTVEIQISNPSTGVTVSDGTVSPSSAVAISGTTTIISSNSAPNFTAFNNNGPVDPGGTITFTATASDPDTNNITLVVCKTQGISGTQCDGGASDTWCTSSAVASNPSCQYTLPSVIADGTSNAYPYVFDSNSVGSESSNQGSLFTYTISNVAPVVSSVTINGGSNIDLIAGSTKQVTVTATVTDNNSCYGSEISSVYGYVYRSGIGTAQSGTNTYYFDGSQGISDPDNDWQNDSNAFDSSTSTYSYTFAIGSNTYAYLKGEGTSAPSSGGNITQVRARIYGGGNDLSLGKGGTIEASIYTDNAAENIGYIYATSTSENVPVWGNYVTLTTPTGGWTWAKIQNLESRIYSQEVTLGINAYVGMVEIEVTSESSLGYPACDTSGEANNNYCYPEITCTQDTGTCMGDTDASANYTCNVNIQYYADPTDTGTQYPDETWKSTIKATDDDSASGNTEVSTGVEMNSLLAFNVTSSINYGSLSIGGSNDPLDRTTVITPTGNVGLDHEVYGPTNMCTDFPTCSGYTIPIGYQKYGLTSSTSYSSGTSLTASATEIETDIPKITDGTATTKTLWWGIQIPTGTEFGVYNGSITISGVKGETSGW